MTVLAALLGLAAALLVPVHASAAATPARLADGQGNIGIQLLEAPVNRRDDPRAHLYIVDHVKPGTTIERRVKVSNDTGERRQFELYPASAEIKNGAFTFAPGRTANELAEWTSVAPEKPVLDPHESIEATVTIAVPEDAAEGERYAVVWAQSSVPPDEKHNVGHTHRVGVRIYLSVGPGGEPPSDFEITDLTAQRDDEGRPSIIAQVRNTGGRALDLRGELRLTEGPGGLSAGPYPTGTAVTLQPGETGKVAVPLTEELPDGPWRAELLLRSGKVERTAAAEVVFPEPGSVVSLTLLRAWSDLTWYVVAAALMFAVFTVALALVVRRKRLSAPARD
jgi:hypothetical protein